MEVEVSGKHAGLTCAVFEILPGRNGTVDTCILCEVLWVTFPRKLLTNAGRSSAE